MYASLAHALNFSFGSLGLFSFLVLNVLCAGQNLRPFFHETSVGYHWSQYLHTICISSAY